MNIQNFWTLPQQEATKIKQKVLPQICMENNCFELVHTKCFYCLYHYCSKHLYKEDCTGRMQCSECKRIDEEYDEED